MTGSRYVVPYAYAYQPTGEPIPGALLNFYVTGSSTVRSDTYSDASLSTPNANPVEADASGTFPNIFLDPNVIYRVVLTYPLNPLTGLYDEVWTADPVSTPDAGSMAFSEAATYAYGTVGKKLQDYHDVRDAPYNAKGDGTTNDRAAFAAADAAGRTTWVPKGTYLIGSSLSLSNSLQFEQGAKLLIPNGVTVTLGGQILAGVWQIFSFSGTGSVVISAATNPFGYSEWFGAISNTPAAAGGNYTAINAALVALQEVRLLAADYWTTGTILNAINQHRLIGSGSYYDGVSSGQATRILCTDSSAAIVQCGPTVQPGSIAAFPQGLVARDFFAIRSVPPLISSDCDGVVVRFAVSAMIDNVKSVDSISGFRFYGTVGCYINQCASNRVQAGSGAGTDNWNGYKIDSTASIGLAGGNASLYLTRCAAGCNITALQAANSNGYLLTGNPQDTFLTEVESVSCAVPINIQGGGADADIQITHPVMDQAGKWGIYIDSLSAAGTVNITDPYVAGKTGTQFLLYVNGCDGAITVNGGQLLCGGVTGLQAVAIADAKGVAIRGTIITECADTVVGVDGTASSNLVIEPTIHNAVFTGGAAVQLATTITASRIAPVVYGKANAFTFGVQVVGTADDRNEYNCTGIDSACINGGSGNKLVRNGVQITAAYTLTGTNTTSGVMT